MKSKILGILVAFFMIIGGIVAGYWDMLESERAELRTIAQRAFDRFSPPEEGTEPMPVADGNASDTKDQEDAPAETTPAAAETPNPDNLSKQSEGTETNTGEVSNTAAANTETQKQARASASRAPETVGTSEEPADTLAVSGGGSGSSSNPAGTELEATRAADAPPADEAEAPSEAPETIDAATREAPQSAAGEKTAASPGSSAASQAAQGSARDEARKPKTEAADAETASPQTGGLSRNTGTASSQRDNDGSPESQAGSSGVSASADTPDGAANPVGGDAATSMAQGAAAGSSKDSDSDAVMLPLTPSQGGGNGLPASEGLRFDVLRVEPDGSMVVAGKGPPNSTITLDDGGTRLGSDKSGPSGDFVVILSEGLPTGAHAIKLVSETEDGTQTVSEETAIIDVPDRGQEDQLLALVESPDAPSRLIDIPVADPSSGSDTNTSGSRTETPRGASGSGESSRQADSSAPTEDRRASPASVTAESGNDATSQVDEASKESTSAAESGGEDVSSSSGSDMSEGENPAPTSKASGETQETVLLPRDEPASAPPAQQDNPNALRVEAIEIDGERIFIAGVAPGGSTIRVYLDNALLAETGPGRAGRFLIEAASSIAVGDHTVRVDQLDKSGAVAARVAVPFSRPDMGSMSAVSPSLGRSDETGPPEADEAQETESSSAPSSAENRTSSGADMASSPADAAEPPARNNAEDGASDDASGRSGSEHSGNRTTPNTSAEEQSTAGSQPTGEALVDSLARPTSSNDQRKADVSSSNPSGENDEPSPSAAPDGNAANSGSQEVSPSSGAESESGPKSDSARDQETTTSTETQDQQSRQSDPAGSDQQTNASGEEEQTNRENDRRKDYSVPTRIQAPLESRTGRVLIRKGDTLWRISRDNYGEGTRYTVIYLANGDQIRNPHLIYPGQVFQMPSKASSRNMSLPGQEN
ncbi:LysM peptidoglycan-binding domain-containing protein [Fulvimarina sp. MAC3]|uniref:LysM peptidoglycan-binding domain-containing protein n=1 Tax=Fulvimarina sp. MAC3 TaxID=3148887 RepID=UPI0031FD430D